MTTKKVKIIVGILFFVIALTALALSITCFFFTDEGHLFSNPMDYTWHEEYGGDAYTGIQNAAADAANNVRELVYLNGDGFANITFSVFLVAGFLFLLVCVCFFALGVKMMLEATVKNSVVLESTIDSGAQPIIAQLDSQIQIEEQETL